MEWRFFLLLSCLSAVQPETVGSDAKQTKCGRVDICNGEEYCDKSVGSCKLCADISSDCNKDFLPAECRPWCFVSACPDPGSIPNGSYPSVSTFGHGNNVTYTCNDGYEMVGESTIECSDFGHWKQPKPYCEKTCRYPPDLINGHVSVSMDDGVSTAKYTCVEGRQLHGPPLLMCYLRERWVTEEGELPQSAPVCLRLDKDDTNYTLQNVAISIAVVEFIVIAGLIGFCCYKRYTNSCQYTPVNTVNDSSNNSNNTHSNNNQVHIHNGERELDVKDPDRSNNHSPKPPKHINNGRSNTDKKPVEETGRTTQGYQEVDKDGPSELVPNISSKCVPIADFGNPSCCTGDQNQDGGGGQGLTPTAPLLDNDAPGAEIGSTLSHIAPTASAETLGDSQMTSSFTDTSRSKSEFEENQQPASFVSDAQEASGASTDVDNYSA
ncbi:CSMD1-like protein [Mya arenaria]|uniref:CSMD1-like protein n=1 Tax=Mya arenaria TaxID=6604 RepID=A0ABY7DA48_MYAAR|nr:CSMD1-like protein [Mya arenaria]